MKEAPLTNKTPQSFVPSHTVSFQVRSASTLGQIRAEENGGGEEGREGREGSIQCMFEITDCIKVKASQTLL